METYSIRHEVGIKASPKAVYQALTDTKKLAGWWTSDTRGNGSKVGDVLEFRFGDFCQKFEVVELQPDRLVRWKANQKRKCGGVGRNRDYLFLKRRRQTVFCPLQPFGLAQG